MKLARIIITKLAISLALIAGLILIIMMVQTVVDVMMNLIAGRPIEGSLEFISYYYMVMVVFLPLAYVEMKHEHISADLVFRLFPKPVQRIIYSLGCLVCVAFFAALTWQTLHDALNAYAINEIVMGAVYITIWPAKAVLPLGYLAITLMCFENALRGIFDKNFAPEPDSPEMV